MIDRSGHDFYGGGFNAAVCGRCGQYDQGCYDKPCPGKPVVVTVDRVEHERAMKLAELAKEVHDSFREGWIFKAHDWLRRYEEACK